MGDYFRALVYPVHIGIDSAQFGIFPEQRKALFDCATTAIEIVVGQDRIVSSVTEVQALVEIPVRSDVGFVQQVADASIRQIFFANNTRIVGRLVVEY